MAGHTPRLAISFLRAAGWRKLITLLALTAVFSSTFVGYMAANAAERNALDWYLSTNFADYQLSPSADPNAPPVTYSTPSDLANLSREAGNVSSAILAIPYVTSAGPFLPTNFVSFDRPSYNATGTQSLYFVTAAMFTAQQADYVGSIIAGTGNLGPSGVLVPEDVAHAEGIKVGQTLPLYANFFSSPANCTGACSPEPAYVNVSVQGIYVPRAGPAPFDNNVFPWTFSNYIIPIILNISGLPALAPTIVGPGFYPWQPVQYNIFVARPALLGPLDTAGNAKRLGALRTQMFLIAQQHKLQLYSAIDSSYSHFLQDRAYIDMTVLFAVGPVILCAVVLGIMMETAEALVRYRDLSVARSRGVGLRRLRRILWLEAILEACVVSLLGLGIGLVASLIFVSDATATLVATYAVAVPVSFALCLCIAVAMKAHTIRGLSKTTIVEGVNQRGAAAIEHYGTERATLIGAGIGATLFGISWFSNAPILDVLQPSSFLFGTERDWLLSLSFFAFLFALSTYIPIIMGRAAQRSQAARQVRDARTLYRSTLARTGRSPDPVVLLVAILVLSASVFATGLVALQRASVDNAIYGDTGGDVLVTLPGNLLGGPAGQNNPPLAAYLAVHGVASVSYASPVPSPLGFSVELVNSTTYLETVRADKLTYGAQLADALVDFQKTSAAVVNDAFVQSTGLGTGSAFGNLTITGVVPRMPGLQTSDQVGQPTIFTDYRNLGLKPSETDILRVLVRVNSTANPTTVAAQLSSLDRLGLTRTAADEVEGLNSSPVLGALGGLWIVELSSFGFLLVVTLAGYAVRIRIELENDFARMRARGLPGRSVPRMLLPPVLYTVLASVLFGFALGDFFLFAMAEVTGPPGSAPLSVLFPPPSVALLTTVFAVLGLGLALGLARIFRLLPLGPRLRERVL